MGPLLVGVVAPRVGSEPTRRLRGSGVRVLEEGSNMERIAEQVMPALRDHVSAVYG